MGADMYLNPPADPRGPERHVVIDMVTAQVWGPYHKGPATTVQRKLRKEHGLAKGRFIVRKMQRR